MSNTVLGLNIVNNCFVLYLTYNDTIYEIITNVNIYSPNINRHISSRPYIPFLTGSYNKIDSIPPLQYIPKHSFHISEYNDYNPKLKRTKVYFSLEHDINLTDFIQSISHS